MTDLESRFWSKVEFIPFHSCWEWAAGKYPSGYGAMWNGHAMRVAHRIAYELVVGPIPEGLQLDHLCRNRGCVNPQHLEPVTQQENIRRGEAGLLTGMKSRAKTVCKRGHPLSDVNLYVNPGDNSRHCRTCTKESRKQYWLRVRNAKLMKAAYDQD